MTHDPYANREPTEKGPPALFDYEKIELPDDVSLEIYFAPHQTAEDLPPRAELEAILGSSDILILEMEGADIAYETKMLNRISKGDFKTLETVQQLVRGSSNPEWKEAFYRSLYTSKTTVVSADLPKGNPLVGWRRRVMEKQLSLAKHPDFDTAVQQVASQWPEHLEALRTRDQYILEHISFSVGEAVANNWRLSEAQMTRPLSVVMFYGNDHYPVAEALEHKASLDGPQDFTLSTTRVGESAMDDIYGTYLRDSSYPSTLDTARELVLHVYASTVNRDRSHELSGTELVTQYFNHIADLDYEELRAFRDSMLGF